MVSPRTVTHLTKAVAETTMILERLGDWAKGSLDSVGAALADMSTSLSHQRHRIAITGLQRSGKTVFVTSFAHALLHAGNAPRSAFPFFPWRDTVRDVSVGEIPGIPPFPYRAHLDELLATPPRWPAPTTALAGLRVRLRHDATGFVGRRLAAAATLDIDLVDYPGEWLLDLPMLAQSYRDWSLQMEELAAGGSRRALAAPWRAAAASLDLDAPEDAVAIARIAALHVDYLRRCRAEKNLYFLQPGRFLQDDAAAPADRALPFFPVGRIGKVRPGSNGAALVRRYRDYQRIVRRFHAQVFGRLRRQVVLVDLLTALQQGHESFADLALAMRTITESFEHLSRPPVRFLPQGRVDRLALVATKADHVSADQMHNLVGLLRDMIGEPFIRTNARSAGLLAVAAVRATTEAMVKWEGRSLPFLTGTPDGADEPQEVYAGIVPGQIPDAAAWPDLAVNIRTFRPPLLPAPHDRPLPHINLDKVLQFLIA